MTQLEKDLLKLLVIAYDFSQASNAANWCQKERFEKAYEALRKKYPELKLSEFF